jgi:glycosyltransferase involved in cell wall biosynthesis
MTTVSVIIPVFNGATFVERSIGSVLTQTFQDFEIIVVDDGSTDNTAQVVQAITDDRLQYIYQSNQGPSAARNNGIQHTRGEFVAFLDSDDCWLPTKLEKQLQRFRQIPIAGLVHCSANIVDVNGNIIRYQEAHLEGQCLESLLMQNSIVTSSVMIPRIVFNQVGCFCESVKHGEDWELWMRIASAFSVAAVREPLVVYVFMPEGFGKNSLAMRNDMLYYFDEAFGSYASHLAHLRWKAMGHLYFGAGVGLGTSGNQREARRELLQAIRLDPFISGAYWRLLLTFFSPAFNRYVRQIKDRLYGWRARRRIL